MKTHFLFFAFFLLPLVKGSTAQDLQLTFNRVAPPTGLHPGSKACVQDAQGYMWIGTYQAPLRRYDGYHYTFYSNNPLDSNSLAQDWVEALCAGRNGIIWIGTAEHGLDRFDPATGNFKHFRSNLKDSNSLTSDYIKALLEDREGILWIGTEKGLNRYDPKTGKFQHYYHDANDTSSLSCNEVMKIYEDRQGTIWIGTGDVWSFLRNKPDEGGLNRLDKKTGKFIRYVHNSKNPHSLINNKVKAIFEDSRGIFWVGTAGDGLHTMNRTNGTFERHLYTPANPEKLSRPAQKKIRPEVADHITFIIEDAAGAIWIGTFGNGLNRYDPKTKSVTHFPLFKDPVSGMLLEVPWWACTSRDGMLWIGYFRGIYRIDPLKKNIPYFATGTAVVAICEDKFGDLWYGTDEGVVRKNLRNGIGQHFVYDPNNPHSLSSNRIEAIYEEHQGELWVGTDKGLGLLNRKTGTFSRYRFNSNKDDSLINQGVGSVYEDAQGSFWLGIHDDLIRINRQEHTIVTHYRHNPEDTNSLSKGEVLLIYEDKGGNLWLATFGGTLNRLSLKTGKVQRFLNSTNIHSLWQDSEGLMWVGTSIGLYRSNAALNSFSRFDGPNSELSGNMIVNGVMEDNQKNLWINASAGICRLNRQRNKVAIFSRNEDPTWYNGTGCYKGKSGELFFGGGSGYFIFSPEQLKENTKPPLIVINELRLADALTKNSKKNPLKIPLSEAKEIRLKHNQNSFSLSFAGIHYSKPEENQHLFILEGLDNTWRKAGEEKTAYYYNVLPGRYTFRVKAASSDGLWAEKSIVVFIAPPWYSTWWAYTIYVLVFSIALWSFVKWRERALKKEKVLLEEKVAIRTHELQDEKEKVEDTLSELKTTQTQLIHSEKTASISKLQQAMLNERLRISRELHDDIGSTLSGIVLYSHLAENQVHALQPGEAEKSLVTIQQSANEMVNRLNDIVWAVNPEHNSLKKLMQKLEEYAMEIAVVKNIKVEMNTPESLTQLQLPVESLHNIYLFGKEAINNAVKYSHASLLELSVQHFDHVIEFTIMDNGKGFDMATVKKGNGLMNMQKRADEAAAILSIQSVSQQGTLISFQCNIT